MLIIWGTILPEDINATIYNSTLPRDKKNIKWPYFSKYSKDINLISGTIVNMPQNKP